MNGFIPGAYFPVEKQSTINFFSEVFCMKHCKWSGILLLLALALAAYAPGYAVTDTIYFSINGDTTINAAVQGDLIGWTSNCTVGASTAWEIYLDLDSNQTIDNPGDKLLFNFIITDGDTSTYNGPGDSDPTPDGKIIVSPLLLGLAPGYYIFSTTDLDDFTSAENWMSISEMAAPPNKFTGIVTIAGHPSPDALLKNIWIFAESDSTGMQMWSALTDDTGYYSINISDAGTGMPFRISAEPISGFVTPSPQYLYAAGQIDGINFDYQAPADSIYGYLEDENHSVINNAGFYAEPQGGGESKDYNSTDGNYVIYFGADELGMWNVGVSNDLLIPNYMVPQNFTYDNSIQHEVEHNFTAYTADTVLYVRVTESGGEPTHQYRIQAYSMTLYNFTEGISGTGADNILALHVSSQGTGYNLMLQTWDDRYPIPPGYIVEGGEIQNVAPGDTANLNLITGVTVQDTIKVLSPDPGVDWSQIWVSLWSPSKNFGANPDNNGVFVISADTGTYTLNVNASRYLALPQSRTVHVTGDTVSGMGFTINYGVCHVTGHITGLALPLDSGLWISAMSGTPPDQYNAGTQIDPATGAFSMYVCDGDWNFYPPSISNAHTPTSQNATVTESDTSLTIDFDYQPMFLVHDTVKVDPGDPAVTMTNVSVTLSGPGGYFTGHPDVNGVYDIYVDSGLFNMTAFYNDYLATPAAYSLHVTGDTAGGLGFTLNKIDVHVSGHLIGVSLPLYSNSLHVNAETDIWPDGYHTTSITIDSITGQYDIYLCNGSWTFTAPDLPGYNSPNTWSTLLNESDTAASHDFSYTSSGVDTRTSGLPTEFSLSQNSPNPFNASTRIDFALPIASQIELTIYNILGQKVKTLAEGEYPAGTYSEIWDGNNQSGRAVASGIYFYRLAADTRILIKKMVVLK
ncbi:hypothetical protein TRIP_C60317 [Candidatus Zixiibacteriota bacterium]|nr:hypothetical protein TRIP_C60317 [candidate division Zixibacteria bacterium]